MPTLSLLKSSSIHYTDTNPDGTPPILLLHGLGASSESWVLQIPVLAEHGYRVICPDTRGFGRSLYRGGDLSVQAMAADFAVLLDSLDAYPAVVVGISMGGTQALQLALDFPHLVKRLMLVNTFAKLRPRDLSGWFYFIQRFMLIHLVSVPKQAEVVSQRLFPLEDQEELRRRYIAEVNQANPSAYRKAFRSLARFNAANELNKLQIPTLVLTGKKDTTVPIDAQISLARNIPGAKHVMLDGGHAVSVENPDAFNSYLLAFIEEDEPDPVSDPPLAGNKESPRTINQRQ